MQKGRSIHIGLTDIENYRKNTPTVLKTLRKKHPIRRQWDPECVIVNITEC